MQGENKTPHQRDELAVTTLRALVIEYMDRLVNANIAYGLEQRRIHELESETTQLRARVSELETAGS